MNYVKYANHVLIDTNNYSGRFENDLPKEESTAKRVALAALPFISLYRPIGSLLSLTMGSCRVITHLTAALSPREKTEKRVQELGQATLASWTLASSFLSSSLGTFLTTAVDGAQGGVSLVQQLYSEQYREATEEALQLAASSLYLSFMLYGQLEAMFLFSLIQAVIGLMQAEKEFAQGRGLEGMAKVLLATLRLRQAGQYLQQIQKQNELKALVKYRSLIERAMKGRSVRHLIEHPFSELNTQAIAKRVILEDAHGTQHDFGAHFHGFGKQLVKGDNLTLRTVTIGGQEMVELDFKVNHAFRNAIQQTIKDLQKLSPEEVRDILSMTHSHVKGIRWGSGYFAGKVDPLFKAKKIDLLGLGSILIGDSHDSPNLYDRVVVHLPKTSSIYDLHEMIAFLNLEQALELSTWEDIDRIKLGHLYRIFFPREALSWERTASFFSGSFEEFKRKVFERTPQMEGIYNRYFAKMKPYEILPGKIRYQVVGLAEEAYRLGARAFTAAITGGGLDHHLFDRVTSILKMGMLSTEAKFENGVFAPGISPGFDLHSGGGDSVFTQMFTEKNIKERMRIDDLNYRSKVRLLFKLEALETGAYQFYQGYSGTRRTDNFFDPYKGAYANRPNILEFLKTAQGRGLGGGHEVMFKERLDPSFIQGIIVDTQQTYENLVTHFRARRLLEKNGQGQECLFNIPIEKFIRIGTHVTESLLAG